MEKNPFVTCRPNGEQFESERSPVLEEDFRMNIKMMLIAFCVSIVFMGAKFWGYWITGSSAILSDALESIINVVAAAFGLGSVIFSAKPADKNHPYGHGKIEFFSAGFEGALILFAAVGIFWEGLKQILEPRRIPNLEIGLFFLVFAGAGNLIMGMILLRTGRKTKSLVLEADGKHLLTDVYTSGAVLFGLIAVYLSGWFRLDGIIACIAGINIVVMGAHLVRKAFGGLMHAADPVLLDEICDLLAANKQELWIDIHRLRAWKSGSRIHVDFHLILPRDIPLEKAHQEVKNLEKAFDDHFSGLSDLLVHLDPCLDPECPVCGVDGCHLRHTQMLHRKIWTRDILTGEASSHERSNS